MSWLSKALGGKTLKIGLAIAGAYYGGKYLSGSGVISDYESGDLVSRYYDPDSFGKIGLTPFSETSFGQTAVGKAIQTGAGFLTSGAERLFRPGTTSVADLIKGFQQMPSARTQVSASPIRSDTAFQAGQTRMMPLGSNGRVQGMLGNDAVQQYMAQRVNMFGMPAIQKIAQTVSMGGGAMAPTIASRKLARKRLVD